MALSKRNLDGPHPRVHEILVNGCFVARLRPKVWQERGAHAIISAEAVLLNRLTLKNGAGLLMIFPHASAVGWALLASYLRHEFKQKFCYVPKVNIFLVLTMLPLPITHTFDGNGLRSSTRSGAARTACTRGSGRSGHCRRLFAGPNVRNGVESRRLPGRSGGPTPQRRARPRAGSFGRSRTAPAGIAHASHGSIHSTASRRAVWAILLYSPRCTGTRKGCTLRGGWHSCPRRIRGRVRPGV